MRRAPVVHNPNRMDAVEPRVGVPSTVHGNDIARADVRKARRSEKPDMVAVAGDLALNGPDPSGTIVLLREMESDGAAIVSGNTDIAVADFDYAAAFPWMTDGVPEAFQAAAEWAHDAEPAGFPLGVYNTGPTPIHCRVCAHGADGAVHSATKYIGGHGTSIGGVVVDAGRFDWTAQADRFPGLTKPDPSYHGVVWADALGPAAYIGRVRTVLLRNTGAALSPFNAFLFLQGLETLPLRMERHSANALRVATHLTEHDSVS